MRICLISSSFFPATFYGGPISSTWDLSKHLGKSGVSVFVSTTNANGDKSLNNVTTNVFKELSNNLFVKYYKEEIINRLSISFILGIWFDIKKSDFIYIQYIFHYTVLFGLLFSLLQRKKIMICPRGSLSYFTFTNRNILLKKIWLNFFIRPFYKKVNWHASSYLERDDIKKTLHDARIVTINDGINFNQFQQNHPLSRIELIKEFTNLEFDYISDIFFSLGRLHSIKCFDVLIVL